MIFSFLYQLTKLANQWVDRLMLLKNWEELLFITSLYQSSENFAASQFTK